MEVGLIVVFNSASLHYFIHFLLISCTFAFNIDTNAPIIKTGVKSSYFGYSVAQHVVQTSAGLDKHVVIVGSPHANISGKSTPVRPGGVYQCPVTSRPDDCTWIVVGQEPLNGAFETEDKSNQWLGVSVASQRTNTGKAMVCAHRNTIYGPGYFRAFGICYSLVNDLTEDVDDLFIENCNGLSPEQNEFGLCQAGVSAHMLGNEVLIGAPGSVNKRGSVFKRYIDSGFEGPSMYHSLAEEPIKNELDPRKISFTHFDSYVGMSVKISKIIKGQTTYIGGAPRSRGNGEVFFFQPGPVSDPASEALLDRKVTLTGQPFGSYFGYDLAVGDFNNDGLEDLAVSAPFYSEPGISGAVYVYLNSADGITLSTQPRKITSRRMKESECIELNCRNARFGFAIASIGDLNLDGFQDLAVGAPYEGKGTLYIFHGSTDGITEPYAQRIYATNIIKAPQLRTFGYSISGGIDVDENGYPDMAVGAYDADQVVVLRARPVVNMATRLVNLDGAIDPKVKECTHDIKKKNSCFRLQACFTFSAKPADKLKSININYTLEGEKFRGLRGVRIFIGEKDKTSVTATLSLSGQDKENCGVQHLFLVDENVKDILNPIQFKLTYGLMGVGTPSLTPGQPLPDLNNFPILYESKAVDSISVDFIKNCGENRLCESDLRLSAVLALTTREGDEYILREGEDVIIGLDLEVQNKGEDAHEAVVYITLPKLLSYRGSDVACVSEGGVLTCPIGNPLPGNDMLRFQVRLEAASDLSKAQRKFSITVQVNTTSTELDPQDDTKTFQIHVMSETDLLVRGKSSPESVFYGSEQTELSDPKFENQIGPEVTHSYEVKNVGKVRVPRATIIVSWPYETSNNKPLLYLMEMELPHECYFDREILNPLQLKSSRWKLSDENRTSENLEGDGRVRRDSRSVYEKIRRRRAADSAGKDAYFNCGAGGRTKCHQIECVVGAINPGDSAVVKVRSRLWNNTLSEDFSDSSEVTISSRVEVKIDPSLEIHQTNTDNDAFWAMTTARIDVASISWWIILIAVLAGIIVLVFLIWLLYFLGFFKRTRPDDMLKHTAEVQKHGEEEEPAQDTSRMVSKIETEKAESQSP